MSRRNGSVVTIGAYDGVHLGHRRVIEDVCRLARAEDLESVVVTFDRHPASVVRPESAPFQLTGLPQRLELLHATGIDDVKVIEFTPERAAESAEDFVDELLVGELGARIIVVGEDFHFGRARGGNVELLQKMGAERGFRVEPFALVADEADSSGVPVSSTRIRALIASGALEAAAHLLGRPHEVRGLVTAVASGAGGLTAAAVAIPAEIQLPPEGSYEAGAGLVGAAGVPLTASRVEVGPQGDADGTESQIVVEREGEPWPEMSPIRVLFPR